MGKTIGHNIKEKRTKRQIQKEFLIELSECASVKKAAKVAKVARSNIYQWRKADPEFEEAFQRACIMGTEALEDEATRRAYEGVKKPVYQGGKMVGTVTEYSDTLLIFLLKGRAPEKYRERRELTGANGSPLIPDPLSPTSGVIRIEIVDPNDDDSRESTQAINSASEEPED